MLLLRRRFRLWPFLILLSACASLPPERAAEEDLMWTAARECQARYSSIEKIERIDSFGRIWFSYLGAGPDNSAFISCYTTLLGRKLEATNLAGSGRIAPSTLEARRTSVTMTMGGTSAFVPVTVNDAETGTLLLDTGATHTVLSPAFAQTLGIVVPPNPRRRIMNVAGGSTITVPFVRVRSVRVGQFTVEALDVGVYDILPQARTVQGVLGTDFLRHFRASLDQATRSLTLEVKASAPASAPAAVSTPTPGASLLGSLSVPAWNVGDEWAYRWKSPRGSGTFVWTVKSEETVDGVTYYVVRSSAARASYYRKDDLAFVFSKVNDRVESRFQPPFTHLVWPLSAGHAWQATYTSERPVDRQTSTISVTSVIEGEEVITVPAGTFRTLRIVQRYLPANKVSFEGWYAPDVKFWVRQREHLSYGVRVRELTSYTHVQP